MDKRHVSTKRMGLPFVLFAVCVAASKANAEYSIFDLGVASRDARAGAINDKAHAVFSTYPERVSDASNILKGDAYLFNGTASTIQTELGIANNEVWDINSYDHAVGWADGTGGYAFAVKYENGIASALGVPSAIAAAINDADQVTGWLFHPRYSNCISI